MSLAAIAEAVRELRHRAELRPLDYWSPTPPQLAFLSDASPVVLLRGANQIGKSAAAIAELIYRCTGHHPHKTVPAPPVEVWLICHSFEQSLSLQSKIWAMLPKDLISPSMEFSPGKGFRGKVPIVTFQNGSILRVKTSQQGSLGLASATISYIGLDEPPVPSLWSELQARVLRKKGRIGITMTPVGQNSVEWLRQLVKDGVVSDHVAALTVENTTPIGGRPLVTQAQIDRIAKAYLNFDRAQRLHGEWEGATEGAVFSETFNAETMITDARLPSLPHDGQPYSIAIGIDHGADAGSQVAVLCAVDKNGPKPRIYCLDEYTAGAATAEAHARGMIEMLNRNGMTTAHVDRWTGDRAYGGKRSGGRMSNMTLMKGFEAVLGMNPGRLPWRLRTAYKPRYSVYHGSQIINECMANDNFTVHPRCEQLIRSIQHWDFTDNEYKHSLDALRYAAVTLIDDKIRSPVKIKMY